MTDIREVRQKQTAPTFSGKLRVEKKKDELFWQGRLAPRSPSDTWNVLERIITLATQCLNSVF